MQHILAFFVLTIVPCVAYPRVSFVLRIVVMALLLPVSRKTITP